MSNALVNGHKAFDFSLNNQDGKAVSLQDFSNQSVVVFFYPKDFTPGCTQQVCGFRDQYATFQDAGVAVIGISGDDGQSHRKFADQHNVPFYILSDIGNQVRNAWGVPKTLGLLPGRVTYVLDKDHVVRHIFSSQLNVDEHIKQALEVIQSFSD